MYTVRAFLTIFEEQLSFCPLWCNSALAVCLFWTLDLNKHNLCRKYCLCNWTEIMFLQNMSQKSCANKYIACKCIFIIVCFQVLLLTKESFAARRSFICSDAAAFTEDLEEGCFERKATTKEKPQLTKEKPKRGKGHKSKRKATTKENPKRGNYCRKATCWIQISVHIIIVFPSFNWTHHSGTSWVIFSIQLWNMFADSDQWGILVYNLEILASGGASWFTFSMKYVCLPFQLLGASDPGQRVAAKLGFSAKFCQQQTFEHSNILPTVNIWTEQNPDPTHQHTWNLIDICNYLFCSCNQESQQKNITRCI